jgi:hypothetical protein
LQHEDLLEMLNLERISSRSDIERSMTIVRCGLAMSLGKSTGNSDVDCVTFFF